MTNFERYRDKILELSNKKFIVAFDEKEKRIVLIAGENIGLAR